MRLNVFTLLFCLISSLTSLAQSDNPHYTSRAVTQRINDLCGGYYEFLPNGYASATTTYPVIIDIHGMGGQGLGTQDDLAKVLQFNTPYFISSNGFPGSFTVNGQTFKFIVIAPQFAATASGSDITDVLDFVKETYRIDTTRIYLTGYSRGGEPTWRFPCLSVDNSKRIAARIPVAGVNSDPDHTGVENIVEADLPVWALHSRQDMGGSTPVSNTINFINAINNLNPDKRATFTELTGNHDNTWRLVYDPQSTFSIDDGDVNIYEWMLTQKRETSILPVTLKYFNATILNNNTISLNWESTYEKNNRDFIIERSANETDFIQLSTVRGTNQTTGDLYNWVDNHPFSGESYYRLSQIDLDGSKTIFNTVKVSLQQGNASVKAYPNPVGGGILNVVFDGKPYHSYHIKVYDANGRVVFSNIYRLSSNNIQINSRHLSAGLNIIEVRSPEMHKIVSVTKL